MAEANMVKRTPKFSDKEKTVLIDSIEKRYAVISGKFSDVIILRKKAVAWVEVTQSVNACGKCR
jgi:hypothetical protein